MPSLKAKGIKVGLVRPITVWPFPVRRRPTRLACQDSVKAVLDVELNEGQMLEDVKPGTSTAPSPLNSSATGGSQMPTTG